MAIAVRCISCGKVANVKNELGGKRAKCTCGAIINVPLPSKPKTCSSCGVDLSNVKRTERRMGQSLLPGLLGCEIGSSQGWSGSQ